MLTLNRARVRHSSTVLVVAGVLALGVGMPGAHAAPLNQEVTGDWVCEVQGHRQTDFRVFNNTAATFSIEKFDDALGAFRSVEVRQSVVLNANMSIVLSTAQAETFVTVDGFHEVWVNIPPEPVTSNFPPAPDARSGSLYFSFLIPWADGPVANGTTTFDARTVSDSRAFTSTDAALWSGGGAQVVTLQTLSRIDYSGFGGNGGPTQQTTAQAELCYRYTFVPAAAEPPTDDPPVDDQPADEPASEPEAGVEPEPSPEPELQRLPDLGPDARTATLTTWALFGASVIVGGVLLRQRGRSSLPHATLVPPE